MRIRMPDREGLQLLTEVVSDRRPDLRTVVARLGPDSLTARQRSEFIDAVADDLQATGFREDWSPNARGELLESLIDCLLSHELLASIVRGKSSQEFMRDSEATELLREVVSTRRPELMPMLDRIGAVSLSADQRYVLQDIASEEFVSTGLLPDDEPNARGQRLHELIDWLAHQ